MSGMARLRNNGFLGRHLERIWEAHRFTLKSESRTRGALRQDCGCLNYYVGAYSIQPPSNGIVAAIIGIVAAHSENSFGSLG